MSRVARGWTAALCLAVLAVPARAQVPAVPSVAQCLLDSYGAGLASGLLADLAGIPKQNTSLAGAYGVLNLASCTINQTTAARNQLLHEVLGNEVQEYQRYAHLFTQTQQVIGYGDTPGTTTEMVAAIPLLQLVPRLLTNQWSTATAQPAPTSTGAVQVTGATLSNTNPSLLFADWSASRSTRVYEGTVQGSEEDFAAAAAVRQDAQGLLILADSVEAELKAGPVHSSRAIQLQALLAFRQALQANVRLRAAASGVRADADAASSTMGSSAWARTQLISRNTP